MTGWFCFLGGERIRQCCLTILVFWGRPANGKVMGLGRFVTPSAKVCYLQLFVFTRVGTMLSW